MTTPITHTESFGVGRTLAMAAGMALLLGGGVFGWAATSQLNAAVIGKGLVKVDRELKTVQHVDGGTVAQILVQPGQHVRQGDVLITLDSMSLEGELLVRRNQRIDLAARAARLRAQRDRMGDFDMPADLEMDPKAQAVAMDEAMLLANTLRDQKSQQAAINARIAQLQHDSDGLEARRTAFVQQYTFSEGAVQRVSLLVKKGSVATAQQETVEADNARLLGELRETEARILSNAAQINELKLQSRRLDETLELESQMELREVEPRLEELRQQIQMLEARIERGKIRAPVSGVVNELPVNTIGQVVAPGELLAVIVPEGADHVIEFQIAPTDVDEVSVGQDARLMFSAFNQKTTPEVIGTILHVAAAATTDPTTGAAVFLAQAKPRDMADLPAHITLLPGMPVDVFVTTQERTALEYMIQPVRQSFARSMTEE